MTKRPHFVLAHASPAVAAAVLLAILASSAGCSKQDDPKPPVRTTPITVEAATTRDLPIIESATGAETVLGFALDYDPTKVTGSSLYVRLPFPIHVANQLRVGQTVRLSSFDNERGTAYGTIREIRPALNATTLSREVMVQAQNHGNWRPLGSIRGEVTLGIHRNAVVIPEQAVVLRPAGTVVYVIESGVAREQSVKTGMTRDGLIEIVQGLSASAAVAVDGAALLSPGAQVTVREVPVKPGAKPS